MSEVSLIFPNQLFKENKALNKKRRVYLVEEFLFFKQYNFHKQKLLLHRASMKTYEAHLVELGYNVVYIESSEEKNDVRILIRSLNKENITAIHFTEVIDDWLHKRIVSACKKNNIAVTQYSTPAFLNNQRDGEEYFGNKKNYFQTDFYIAQRKKRNILLGPDGGALGGRWSYDADNRKKFPAKELVPQIYFPAEDNFVVEAREYVALHFNDNYGEIEKFFYPVNFVEAEKWLKDFLIHRLEKFGDYEDAIVSKENFLHHSVLSPLINTGLLTPLQVINAALDHAQKNAIPINSTEGFIRQIIGWREFIKTVYEREGVKQRTTNYWKFSKKNSYKFLGGNYWYRTDR